MQFVEINLGEYRESIRKGLGLAFLRALEREAKLFAKANPGTELDDETFDAVMHEIFSRAMGETGLDAVLYVAYLLYDQGIKPKLNVTEEKRTKRSRVSKGKSKRAGSRSAKA